MNNVTVNLDKRAVYAVAEINMDLFAAIDPAAVLYREPSRFPGIDIDLTFAINPADLVFAAVEADMRTVGGAYLTDVTVTDVYEGENGNSITFRLSFTSPDKTLSKAELQPSIDAILAKLAENGMALKTV